MSGLSKDNLRFSPSAAKYFKKLKDKKLINRLIFIYFHIDSYYK